MALRALLDQLPLLLLLLLAAVIDIRQRRIPNWLTLGLITSGLARAAFVGGWAAAGLSLAGVCGGAAVPFLLFIMGGVGGGDVKLFAGIGAWLGPREALAVFTVQCLVGLVIVLVQAAQQGRIVALFRNSAILCADISRLGLAASAPGKGGSSITSIDRPLPYVVPVSVATVMVILAPIWLGL